MKHEKPLIRRTFLQERFMILIERQQAGEATFAELTELDELVNRDPKLRDIILEEMEEMDTPADLSSNEEPMKKKKSPRQNILEWAWSYIRAFHLFYNGLPTSLV